MIKSPLSVFFRLLICCAALGAQPPIQQKAEPPKESKATPATQDAATQPAKPPEATVPNLQDLILKPADPMRMIVQRFDLDRGNLNRTYVVAQSPTRQARL